jgi:RNA polymerase sigma factor (sigma-70 family)
VEPVKSEFLPTRLSLLSRLHDVDNQESWREFFDTYWKLIYSAAMRAGLSDAEAQDVVQETVISVFKNLPDYDSKAGSFKGWLLKMTRWRIVDQLRKRRFDDKNRISKGPKAEQSEIEAIPDPAATVPDSFWDEEWERNVFEKAIERAKMKVDPKQFQVFDLYVLKEWPVKKVREALGVSATQIYLAKHRVSRVIKKEIKAAQIQQGPKTGAGK